MKALGGKGERWRREEKRRKRKGVIIGGNQGCKPPQEVPSACEGFFSDVNPQLRVECNNQFTMNTGYVRAITNPALG